MLGLLRLLWNAATTLIVVVPKTWPIIKMLMTSAVDWYVQKRSKELGEKLKSESKKAEETKDTSELETGFLVIQTPEAKDDATTLESGLAVGVTPIVASPAPTFTASAAESGSPTLTVDDEITQKIVIGEEKKSPQLETSWISEHHILVSFFEIAGVLGGLSLLEAAFGGNEAKAASLGVGSSSSSVIMTASKNKVYFRGGVRMGSRLLGILLCAYLFNACAPKPVDDPKGFRPKIYSGDSGVSGIHRAQSQEIIRCDSPEIDKYMAMEYSDYACLKKIVILGCPKDPVICD